MGRAGAGSNQKTDSEENSRTRTGGGHRVGTSDSSRNSTENSRAGGGSRVSVRPVTSSPPSRQTERETPPPPPKRTDWGTPPPPRRTERETPPPPPRRTRRETPPPSRYTEPEISPRNRNHSGYSSHYSNGALTVVLAVFIIIIAVIALLPKFKSTKKSSTTFSSYRQNNTAIREKLDTNNAYIEDCIIDELAWFDDVSKTEKQLKNFWEKTGIQPYIIFRDYDMELTTDSQKERWAISYYDKNFSTENIFLFVYFAEEDTENEVGYMAYANGYETSSVMDSKAVDIFWDNIDKYWYTDLSTDDVMIKAFNDTADAIM